MQAPSHHKTYEIDVPMKNSYPETHDKVPRNFLYAKGHETCEPVYRNGQGYRTNILVSRQACRSPLRERREDIPLLINHLAVCERSFSRNDYLTVNMHCGLTFKERLAKFLHA
ncbi:MAG: hypothetical protein CVU64_10305 [Deltaproteobacteria bacterium HGW-Deltaproteobacteria-21]|nr:MAG: hypothetical protein CVU64_10305 [Deltaproteobacteria bacterium HGW-Deltaproteobacteria-21]